MHDRVEGSEPDDERTRWLVQHEKWLTLLARCEIDSRFQGKFSASDAVQQTMMAAWKDWDDFRGTNTQQRLAWLRKILAHQLAHLARHYAGTKKRDVNREVSLEASLAQSSSRLGMLVAAGETSPSGQAAEGERQRMIAEVLEQLPDEYRQVIILRNLEDRSHAEIARRMHRSEGAVRMLWLRALERLKIQLEQHACGNNLS